MSQITNEVAGQRKRLPYANVTVRSDVSRDVFSYAAYAALFAFTVHAPDDTALEPWARAWQRWIGDAFLREYQSIVADAPWAPGNKAFPVLLTALTLDKALYEMTYELNNRPEWVRIPLTGLLDLSA